MAAQQPIRLVGGTGSPYTQKMVALLRYRRVPYAIIWGQPDQVCDELGVEKPKPIFMPTCFFEGEGGLEPTTDSTPIIRRLEEMYPGRSVLPEDPALACIDYLIEDFADEWCTKYMFHYRWYPEVDADNAGTLLPLGFDVSVPKDGHEQLKQWVSERQINRLYVVGMVQCHSSIPVPPLEPLRGDERLAGLRQWLASMHERFRGYPHLHSGSYFEPYLRQPVAAGPVQRGISYLGLLTIIVAFPVTVPPAFVLMSKVTR